MTLRVACVGAGYFSQFHIGSWQRMARAILVGLCDKNLDKAAQAGVPAFDNLERMLADIRPQLLDIILPPSEHADAICAAITHGVPTIICQKPFCASLQEAREMVARADKAGATLIVHENFRFQPWYRFIKEVLDSKRIGKMLQATFRLRPGDGQGPDVYLDRQPYFRTMPRFLIHETGVHWVDVFRFLFGEPSHVYADLRRVNDVIEGEDAGYVIFDFPEGLRAVFDGNRSLDHKAHNTRRTMGEALFEGTEGTLTLRGDGAVIFRRFGASEEERLLPPDNHVGFGGDCTHALQTHVVSGLMGERCLENEAKDYLRNVEIEVAIYTSARTGTKLSV